MFFGMRKGSSPAGEGRRRSASKAVVDVESLEGKLLLSHAGTAHLAHPALSAADTGLPGTLQVARFNQPGPIRNEVGVGYADKVVRFYKYYTGPILGQLNAAGAKAQIVGDNLLLTGIVGGKIVANPTSAGAEEYYYFGINRGGATTPAPSPAARTSSSTRW